jgi:hypothetical protein
MTKNENGISNNTAISSSHSVALDLVNEAAQLAPVPVLQSAASLALEITSLAQVRHFPGTMVHIMSS